MKQLLLALACITGLQSLQIRAEHNFIDWIKQPSTAGFITNLINSGTTTKDKLKINGAVGGLFCAYKYGKQEATNYSGYYPETYYSPSKELSAIGADYGMGSLAGLGANKVLKSVKNFWSNRTSGQKMTAIGLGLGLTGLLVMIVINH